MTTLISIIIPTFNVEKYIAECLNSLINQSFSDFEIIVVDDCSTDSTLEIVKYFANKDCRIRFFENDKKVGSGGSRNFGLKQAKGKYIQFVDGDDWLDRNTLEKLYTCAEKFNAHIVIFKVLSFFDSSKHFFKEDYLTIPVLEKFNNKLFNSTEIFDEMFEISVSPINKLYLRLFLEDVGACFPENIIHQDNPFFYQVFCEAKRIYLLDEYFYNRRIWKGSITTLRDDTELGTVEIVEKILQVFLNNGLYNKFKISLLNRLIFKLRNRYNFVGNDFKKDYYFRVKLKLIKFISEYELYDDFIECLDVKNRIFFENVLYSNSFDEFIKDYIVIENLII